MAFNDENFLLQSRAAERLYHDYAADCPIYDYHSHLDPARLADDVAFNDLTEAWLDGDHYKWRAMRACAVAEEFITGDAAPREKFRAWSEVVPKTLMNPLYHWTHMELKNPFGVETQLSGATADSIFDCCNEQLQSESFRPQSLLRARNVKVVCTTDDPADDLAHHVAHANTQSDIAMYPTYRPDAAFAMLGGDAFRNWLKQLSEVTGREISSLTALLEAMVQRAEFFDELGCKASDHGFSTLFPTGASEKSASDVFEALRSGGEPDDAELDHYRGFLLARLAETYHKLGWAQQFHVGALRNTNSAAFKALGPDTGFDTIGSLDPVPSLQSYLDHLAAKGTLPRTILYNINPRDNDVMAALIGSFQSDIPGKLQWGSAWWFNDQKTGIEAQLSSLANMGLLSLFVGMVTDSRSYLSFSRHEYFRRVLANLLGNAMQTGEIPDDFDMVGALVQDISSNNTRDYFGYRM